MSQDCLQENGPAAADDQNLDVPASVFRTGSNPESTSIAMPRRPAIGIVNSRAIFTTVVDEGGEESDGRELAIFEGDIVLGTPAQARAAIASDKGIGIDPEFRWPGGVIPYVTVSSLRTHVANAINHWQQRTPLRFVERTDEEDYISFERHDGSWSHVGRQRGMQVISLAFMSSLGTAIHEIGHAIGLFHEQSRSDRDSFVRILIDNVPPADRHNFETHVQDATDLGNYDFGSIMHYPADAFSIDGGPTIVTLNGENIGQRQGLSAGDIGSVRAMYPDLNWS